MSPRVKHARAWSSQADGPGLRQGFTTGSAAAAACKAAVTLLIDGGSMGATDIPVPSGQSRLRIPVERAWREGADALASVVKNAGDDPDATHGVRIRCRAHLETTEGGQEGLAAFHQGVGAPAAIPMEGEGLIIAIEGGRGVGRVTLPGLPVPVGRAAINPAPCSQIEAAVREAMAGRSGRVRLLVEAENGEEIARKTLNPRLGIVGGISILGTQGIVKPYSHEAWRATIDSGLSVARSQGFHMAAFSTGRRSERLLMEEAPDLPDLCFVQAADYFAHAVQTACAMGFTEILWGCFFGKLAKMAQGLPYTHARTEPTDFAFLASLAAEAGADPEACEAVRLANTARHALELLEDAQVRQRFADITARKALGAALCFASAPKARPVGLRVICFGFEGGVLTRAYTS